MGKDLQSPVYRATQQRGASATAAHQLSSCGGACTCKSPTPLTSPQVCVAACADGSCRSFPSTLRPSTHLTRARARRCPSSSCYSSSHLAEASCQKNTASKAGTLPHGLQPANKWASASARTHCPLPTPSFFLHGREAMPRMAAHTLESELLLCPARLLNHSRHRGTFCTHDPHSPVP